MKQHYISYLHYTQYECRLYYFQTKAFGSDSVALLIQAPWDIIRHILCSVMVFTQPKEIQRITWKYSIMEIQWHSTFMIV